MYVTVLIKLRFRVWDTRTLDTNLWQLVQLALHLYHRLITWGRPFVYLHNFTPHVNMTDSC
jgi:hypothetical protein